MLRGTFMRKGTTGQTPSTDIFSPIEFAIAAFSEGTIFCTAEDPFGPAIGWKLKPHQGPKQVSMHQEILLNMLPGTPHYAAKIPEEGRRVSPSPDTCYTYWTVQLYPNLYKFQHGIGSGAVRWLDESWSDG